MKDFIFYKPAGCEAATLTKNELLNRCFLGFLFKSKVNSL